MKREMEELGVVWAASTAVVVKRVSSGGRSKRVFHVSSGQLWCGCWRG